MKPIYITDLDHTFLRSDLSISEFSRNIWNATSQHAILSIATARSFYSATTTLKGLHFNAPMILLDGALIVTHDKKIIDTKYLDYDITNELIQEVNSLFDLQPFVIGLKEGELNESFDFPKKQTLIQQKLLVNYKKDPRLIEYETIVARQKTFKIVYMGSFEELNPLASYLNEKYGRYFEFKLSPENYSGGYFLTILNPLGDKAHGLATLSEYLNEDLSRFTVFGDSINDIGMFKLAGTSVAVSNALEEAKAHANIISEHSNDNDAVARYLQEH